MQARADLWRTRDDTPTEDHYVHLHGASWDDYERILAIRGDHSAPRITFIGGTIEIMSPSRDHEGIKSMIGRLVETYCLDRGIEIMPFGSWTLKVRKDERGVEPDECYVFGTAPREHPQLAIEVEWTAGGLDKLDVYRRLHVEEVWYWRRGAISVHRLRGDRYARAARSTVVPDLPLDLLARCLDRPTLTQAVRAFRAGLTRPK